MRGISASFGLAFLLNGYHLELGFASDHFFGFEL
jgi:hypothetical protein